ncbi:hypothetical protein BD779DRAFT_1561132 [Infundibulicybe gibba]|nr:hypothetical protein BD779DRAFT_1561132 [Infundibulicybe gibba]
MKDYAKLVSSTADEVAIFRRKQRREPEGGGARKNFLKEWNGSATITAPMFASVWKINCAVGGVIQSAGEVLIILEAMKTEVPVKAGPSNVGKMIRSLGDGIKLEATVRPGDVLLVLE